MPVPTMDDNKLLILYASQTGTAEAVAEELSERITDELNIKHRIMCVSKASTEFKITKEELVVFVVSSTGDGDPPDTATKLWRQLRLKKVGDSIDLSQLSFAVLGLGDTNYSHFCGAAKGVQSKCLALGANNFMPIAVADDAVGLEEVIEPWTEKLLKALKQMKNGTFTPPTPEKVIKKPSEEPSTTETDSIEAPEVDTPVKDSDVKTSDSSAQHRKQLYERLSSVVAANASAMGKQWLAVDLVDESVEASADTAPAPYNDIPTYHVPITKIVRLSGERAAKHAGLVELDLTDSKDLQFQAGDAFGIFPQNDPEEVQELLERLGLWDRRACAVVASVQSDTEKTPIPSVPTHLTTQWTLHTLFTDCLDIRSLPKKAFLRYLGECNTNATERNCLNVLAGRTGSKLFIEEIAENHVSLLQLLALFPSTKPQLSRLLEYLTPIHPRYYSAASCPESHPHSVEFAYTVVEHTADEASKYNRGVCTGWLERLRKSEAPLGHARVFAKVSHHFRMPEDLDTPVILIGPGTGVAPFIGFLRHRRATMGESTPKERISLKEVGEGDELTANAANGLTWLFFGCRTAENDFIYKDEMYQLQQDGVLDRLTLAFSRDASPTPVHMDNEVAAKDEVKYVQHHLAQHGRDISDLVLKHNASVYVCGDARNMAKDVDRTLKEILVQHGGLDAPEAAALMERLDKDGRYKRDIWA